MLGAYVRLRVLPSAAASASRFPYAVAYRPRDAISDGTVQPDRRRDMRRGLLEFQPFRLTRQVRVFRDHRDTSEAHRASRKDLDMRVDERFLNRGHPRRAYANSTPGHFLSSHLSHVCETRDRVRVPAVRAATPVFRAHVDNLRQSPRSISLSNADQSIRRTRRSAE